MLVNQDSPEVLQSRCLDLLESLETLVLQEYPVKKESEVFLDYQVLQEPQE